jgi:16S rRNA (cytosine967-C5)-methyltransferase
MADKLNIREAAVDTLVDMESTGKLSHVAIDETLMRIQFAPKQDRAFYTLLCEGTTERRIYLDYVLDSISKTKMKKCRPFIRALLRLSAYQILFTNVRDAAACNEAVVLAKKRGFRNLSGFVNGVLRNLSRQKEHICLPDKEKDPEYYLVVKYSMPAWIVKKFMETYGLEDTEIILSSFLEARPVTARVNRRKTNPEKLTKELEEQGIRVSQAPWFDDALYLSGFSYLGRNPAFLRGDFTVQDISSMLPVAVADLSPGDRVVDVCAAPGGKTFHAADIVGPDGLVIARDLTENKTEYIKENNERMGYAQLRIEEWDARIPDESLFEAADLVIADLPCSGLGIMGRKNDIKYHMTEEQTKELVELQREILSVVWRYVKPGGQLIYSTCTMNQAENEDNVQWIKDNTPLFPVSMEDKLPEDLKNRTGEKGWLQVVPGIDPGDGFFVSKWQRRSS